MDPPVKAGPLLLQQPPGGLRLGAKRWKKSWFVLYPASSHGVARLEFFDCKEGAVAADRVCTKRLDKKIVRLADCVSIAPAPECSAKEGLSVFRLETSERTYVFAAEPQEVTEWVARLCETAFPGSPGQAGQPPAERGRERALEMATNSIYDSREEVSEFRVTVQKTEAAERCRLRGPYVLRASRSSLALAEPHSSSPLYTWPYRLLRRYGRDKVMFSFEAGRRCESGPGNFAFETKQGNEIFHVVQAAIQAQKAQVEENRQSSGSLDAEAAGVAHIQSTLANLFGLEGEGPGPEQWPTRKALTAKLSLALEKETAVREPPAQWPCTPPRSPLPGVPSEDVANVYAEPLDAVKGSRPRPDTLYADPVDTRREGGVGQESWPQATKVLYEQVGPGPSSHQGLSSGKVHIYDEPEGRALLPAPASAPAAIYDEACLPCEAWRTQARESQAGYELPFLPGAGDYAVPAFHQKAGPKAPKPCPAPKLPRARRKSPQPGSNGAPRAPSAPERNGLLGGSGNSSNNNSNASRELLAGEHGTEEPLYSRVLRLPPGRAGHPGPEQSVDGSRPASVYEDLGEI
ncbi:Docking protein 1 [Varanus komodoensis]|uniref:docking protein 1 n=1 Tax=Varanus komodoensis TaxID=61221 RepID=UPI001CF7D435|nr:docking protein 1 [Varanus komodoensis]KAF7252739.1 Docking protein 1 [Varanus komodoensis]